MANSYPLGSKIRISGSFAAANHSLIDPDTVTLTVKSPQGIVTTYAYPANVTRKSTGVYYMDLAPATSGAWSYRWASTGNGQAAAENTLVIASSSFA